MRLHIGTSGWSYKHWAGIFYPAEVKPEKYLEYYITKFECVELNSCFYHLPRKSTVEGWMNRTTHGFRFCNKLSRLITHQMRLTGIEKPLQNFFEVFEIMKSRMGPVLIQLPPGLDYDKPLISNFIDLIKDKYSQFRFAVEIRNRSWINEGFFDLLALYKIGFVIADSGNRYPYHEIVTSDFVYIRFHGREQLYSSFYDEAVLWEYAVKIEAWVAQGKEIWVFFNNDFYGYAVKNADMLCRILLQMHQE